MTLAASVRVRLDAHAHLYPSYDPERLCSSAFANLVSGEPGTIAAVLVMDREGQDSISLLGVTALPGFEWRKFSSLYGGVVTRGADVLLVLGGAQYVSSERIEVLSIGGARLPIERLPATEIVHAIADSGRSACLPWSPGKWAGERGRMVRKLLEGGSPSSLTVGDIAMRPAIFPRPALLSFAVGRGYRMLYGSDPLPFDGEELAVGCLGVQLEIPSEDGDPEKIAGAVLSAVSSADHPIALWGSPDSFWRGAARFLKSNTTGRLKR